MTADKPSVKDVMAHLDELASKVGLARAGMWGAVRATAPADRWDGAKADLEAAAVSLAAALEALAAMEKTEAYCTVCGEPILDLMAGWSHFTGDGRAVNAASAGHKPALDWRQVGTPGERTPLCPNCHAEPTGEDGLCWECADDGDG